MDDRQLYDIAERRIDSLINMGYLPESSRDEKIEEMVKKLKEPK